MTDSLALVAGGLIVLTGMALVGVGLRWRQSTAIEDLLAEFDATPADLDEYTQRLQSPFASRLMVPLGRNVIGSLQSLLPRHYIAGVRRRLVLAGLSGRFGAEEYVAGQVVGAALGILLGVLVGVATDWSGARIVAATVGGGLLGFFAPALYTKQHRDLRVEEIERELADVLDVLAISVEAGVGLEGAIQAVVERFSSPLGDELGHMLSEMELGLSRREALQNLRAGHPRPQRLRPGAAAGRRAGHADDPRAADPGRGDAAPAARQGSRGRRQAAGQDPVPPDPVHPPRTVHRDHRPGRDPHRQQPGRVSDMRIPRSQDGATSVEYGLIAAGAGLAFIVAGPLLAEAFTNLLDVVLTHVLG